MPLNINLIFNEKREIIVQNNDDDDDDDGWRKTNEHRNACQINIFRTTLGCKSNTIGNSVDISQFSNKKQKMDKYLCLYLNEKKNYVPNSNGKQIIEYGRIWLKILFPLIMSTLVSTLIAQTLRNWYLAYVTVTHVIALQKL